MNKPIEKFGTGDGIVRRITAPDFDDQPLIDQAIDIAYPAGCPIPEQLSNWFGAENMRQRYIEVGVWFKIISDEIKDINPSLYEELMTNVSRQGNVGLHESDNVPDDYSSTLYPINTLPGFSLPRIFLVASGIKPSHETDKSDYSSESSEKLTDCMNVITNNAKISNDTFEFVARVAEDYTKSGVNSKDILSHVMCRSWLDEHEEDWAMDSMKTALSEFAPTLWDEYIAMSDFYKVELDIEV